MLNIKRQLKDLLVKLGYDDDKVNIDYPSNLEHGDYATNLAMVLAKEKSQAPVKVAEEIIKNLSKDKFIKEVFSEIEAVKPGFINFHLKDEFLVKQIDKINKAGDKYGASKIGQGQKVQVEFISANPTGPLTLGNGRGGTYGDVLANILSLSGFKVEREYYINDAGNQVKVLGLSLLAAAGVIDGQDDYYSGEYIKEWVKQNDVEWDEYREQPEELGYKAAADFIQSMIKPSVGKLGVKFDVWFSEKKELHDSKQVDKILDWLTKHKLVYDKEGAKWMKTEQFGDKKDRVLVTGSGEPTYFLVDLAYHKNKFDRNFDKVINIWGADHHGYIDRVQAGMKALEHEGELIIKILQLVRILEDGKEVRMSKRKGTFIVLDELIDEVGVDVVRWFFLMRSLETHMDFDLTLAKEQSKKNPVYYVQYAFVRLSSIIEQTKKLKNLKTKELGDYKLAKEERQLIVYLLRWPELIEEVAQNYQVHSLTTYAHELADKIQKFYETSRVIENNKINSLRLELTKAAKVVLGNALKILGIKAPEKM